MQEAALRRGDRDRAKGGSKQKSMKGLLGGAQATSPRKARADVDGADGENLDF